MPVLAATALDAAGTACGVHFAVGGSRVTGGSGSCFGGYVSIGGMHHCRCGGGGNESCYDSCNKENLFHGFQALVRVVRNF